jgi:hypothetical protein
VTVDTQTRKVITVFILTWKSNLQIWDNDHGMMADSISALGAMVCGEEKLKL